MSNKGDIFKKIEAFLAKIFGPNASPQTFLELTGAHKAKDEKKYADHSNGNKDGNQGCNNLKEKAANKNLTDRPTTADGPKGLLDLPSCVAQVGKNSVRLPNAYNAMDRASLIMAGMGSSNSDGKKTPSSSIKIIIEDALTGAMKILVLRWGYDKVIRVFDKALENDNINLIDEEYREIVLNAVENIKLAAIEYGKDNIPVYTYSEVTTIGQKPSPIVNIVPDLYVQEYYLPKDDPYPGFIKWNSPDETDFVFTERKLGDKYFVTPKEEVYSIAEQELADALNTYIELETLTARILNEILNEQNENVENNIDEKMLGKGAGSGGGNALSLIQQLLGAAGTSTNNQRSEQQPVSVCNNSSIEQTLKNFEKNLAKAKQMKNELDKAFTPKGPTSEGTV